MGVVGLAENKATQPSLAGAWAELGNNKVAKFIGLFVCSIVNRQGVFSSHKSIGMVKGSQGVLKGVKRRQRCFNCV